MKTSALVIVDMLRDFTDPAGAVYYPQNREILPRIRVLLEAFRRQRQLIIFLQQYTRPEKPDSKAANMRPNCFVGTWGAEIDPLLLVDERRDYVIPKRRYSGFFATDLDLVLREHEVKRVVIVGTKTNCCIRATVTDAFYLNYDPIVIADCVATNSDVVNQVHLEDIRKYFGEVISSEECIARLERGEL